MLAIKSIMAKYKKLPSIIFDEIDTGVSGEISKKMGFIMKDLGKRFKHFRLLIYLKLQLWVNHILKYTNQMLMVLQKL